MNNLSSYCGLVDAKIRASDKNLPVKDHVEDEGLEKAGFILQGNRPHAELEAVKAPDGRVLMRRSWSPPEGTETIGLLKNTLEITFYIFFLISFSLFQVLSTSAMGSQSIWQIITGWERQVSFFSFYILYVHHYKPRLVYLLPHCSLGFIL